MIMNVKNFFAAAALPLMLALLMLCTAGCGPTVKVGKNTYRAMTKRETEIMIGLARNHIKRNVPKVVEVHECDIALREAPEMKVVYYGDMRGNAKLTWYFPKRKFTVEFIGEFLSRDMYCLFQTVDKLPDTIDFRPKSEQNIPTLYPGIKGPGLAPAPAAKP